MAVTEYQEVSQHWLLPHHYPALPLFRNEANIFKRVYALLCQIPKGRVSSYACLSKALSSSPRAVGGALRRNPFAPEVPCHRIICADGVSASSIFAYNDLTFTNCGFGWKSIGGFKGEPQDAPSGINQKEKLRLLKSEGVLFENGFLVERDRMWNDFKV